MRIQQLSVVTACILFACPVFAQFGDPSSAPPRAHDRGVNLFGQRAVEPQLEGVWTPSATFDDSGRRIDASQDEKQLKIVFHDGTCRAKFPDGREVERFTYRLGKMQDGESGAIDVVFPDDSRSGSLGIWEIDGQRLRLCFARAGQGRRPDRPIEFKGPDAYELTRFVDDEKGMFFKERRPSHDDDKSVDDDGPSKAPETKAGERLPDNAWLNGVWVVDGYWTGPGGLEKAHDSILRLEFADGKCTVHYPQREGSVSAFGPDGSSFQYVLGPMDSRGIGTIDVITEHENLSGIWQREGATLRILFGWRPGESRPTKISGEGMIELKLEDDGSRDKG